MFRMANLGRIWVPVGVPDQDGEDTTIHLLMQVMDEDELADREKSVALRTADGLLAKAKKMQTREDLAALLEDVNQVRKSDKAELIARTHDWRGVHDENGEEVAFSRDHLTALMRWPWLAKRVRKAFFDASREGVAKNSLPGLAGAQGPVQA
ncbi:MAG TPA: hypothetical protein VLF15_10425 [Pseudoxanthomonas sp.]|nr:hypothetical protein [Pseudoxanthomonas sp.]